MLDQEIIALAVVNVFGGNRQIDMGVSAMAELTNLLMLERHAPKEIVKAARRQDILGAIAAVQLALDQLRAIYGDTAEIEQHKRMRLVEQVRKRGGTVILNEASA